MHCLNLDPEAALTLTPVPVGEVDGHWGEGEREFSEKSSIWYVFHVTCLTLRAGHRHLGQRERSGSTLVKLEKFSPAPT
jgi:hypothetical protein